MRKNKGKSKNRKIIKHKTATFNLEPDGFSIHTFSLSRQLTQSEYHVLKKNLYRDYPGTYKTDSKGEDGTVYIFHNCRYFNRYGVRIRLMKCCFVDQKDSTPYDDDDDSHDTFSKYFLKMTINPRRLIEPIDEYHYLGILQPTQESVDRVVEVFWKLFWRTIFENDIDQYKLSRIDFCTNIRCDNKNLFRELVRVLRKLPTPPKYERLFYDDDDRKKANRYNKHYLRFACRTHELVIYDKTYQIEENQLDVSYEKLPNGVIRFEMHCRREYLRRLEKKLDCSDTDSLLHALVQHTREELVKKFSKCFPNVSYYQADVLQEKIRASHYKKKNKEAMYKLVELLKTVQSVDKALEKLEAKGYDTSGLLKKFEKLGISPVPLRKDFCAERLPGLVELLNTVGDEGGIVVPYTVVKYK